MSSSPTVALVGCVKRKRPGTHPAGELYVSPLFTRRREYVESRGLSWFIISAEYWLVRPTDLLTCYDRTLNAMSAAERREWGRKVLSQLEECRGCLRGVAFEIHAGAKYLEAIEHGLRNRGATVTVPTAGLGLGQQLAWYARNTPRK